jgi:hypothetical protein
MQPLPRHWLFSAARTGDEMSTFDALERLIAAALAGIPDRHRGRVISAALHRVQGAEDRQQRHDAGTLLRPIGEEASDIAAADAIAELDARGVTGNLLEFVKNSLRARGVDEVTIAVQVGDEVKGGRYTS